MCAGQRVCLGGCRPDLPNGGQLGGMLCIQRDMKRSSHASPVLLDEEPTGSTCLAHTSVRADLLHLHHRNVVLQDSLGSYLCLLLWRLAFAIMYPVYNYKNKQ